MNLNLVKNICSPVFWGMLGSLITFILLAEKLHWKNELLDLNSKIDKIVIFLDLDLNAEDEVKK